jgi:hypothetical protein
MGIYFLKVVSPNTFVQELLKLRQLELLQRTITLSYPLNYALSELLIPTVLQQNYSDSEDLNSSKYQEIFIEDWEEHFDFLTEFAQDVCAVPRDNFCLLFFSFFH